MVLIPQGLQPIQLADASSSHFPPPAFCCCRREAARDAAAEPMLSSFLHACILSHNTFADALAFVLSKRLASPCFMVSSAAGTCGGRLTALGQCTLVCLLLLGALVVKVVNPAQCCHLHATPTPAHPPLMLVPAPLLCCAQATELFELFVSVLGRSPHIVEAAIEDVRAVYQRVRAALELPLEFM